MNIDIEGCRTDNTFHKQHERGSKCDGSDSGPDEVPVQHENGGDTFHTSVESHKCKGMAENHRKRRRHHKRNSCKELNSPATEKRESMNNERSSLNKLSRVRQRKLTLLEKVSELMQLSGLFIAADAAVGTSHADHVAFSICRSWL
jgi:hypothetical protein